MTVQRICLRTLREKNKVRVPGIHNHVEVLPNHAKHQATYPLHGQFNYDTWPFL